MSYLFYFMFMREKWRKKRIHLNILKNLYNNELFILFYVYERKVEKEKNTKINEKKKKDETKAQVMKVQQINS